MFAIDLDHAFTHRDLHGRIRQAQHREAGAYGPDLRIPRKNDERPRRVLCHVEQGFATVEMDGPPRRRILHPNARIGIQVDDRPVGQRHDLHLAAPRRIGLPGCRQAIAAHDCAADHGRRRTPHHPPASRRKCRAICAASAPGLGAGLCLGFDLGALESPRIELRTQRPGTFGIEGDGARLGESADATRISGEPGIEPDFVFG